MSEPVIKMISGSGASEVIIFLGIFVILIFLRIF